MKALSIHQPFAALIANGEKFVENRTWETRYRGPLAIHASKGSRYLSKNELAEYATGCIVAVADLLACCPLCSMYRLSRHQTIRKTNLTIGSVLDHEHTEGPWCWILTDIRKLNTPIPFRGTQGLFDVPDDLLLAFANGTK